MLFSRRGSTSKRAANTTALALRERWQQSLTQCHLLQRSETPLVTVLHNIISTTLERCNEWCNAMLRVIMQQVNASRQALVAKHSLSRSHRDARHAETRRKKEKPFSGILCTDKLFYMLSARKEIACAQLHVNTSGKR